MLVRMLRCAGLFALWMAVPAHAEEGGAFQVPEDYEPLVRSGVALVETPVRHRVELLVRSADGTEVPLRFQQDNRTLDHLKMQRASSKDAGAPTNQADMEALDPYYARWGFKPLAHRERIRPRWLEHDYVLDENVPTYRQFCGGFALAPLLGGVHGVDTDEIWKLVQAIGSRTDDPAAWDVVVFSASLVDGAPHDVGHFALIESTGPATATTGLDDKRWGKVILTKNQQERAYRGNLSDFVSTVPRLSDPFEKAPAQRPGKWEFTFWRVPWHTTRTTRPGGPYADDSPLLHASSTVLRVQVADAHTYALLDGSKVELRFRGSSDVLKTVESIPGGVFDFASLPGSSGRYTLTASAPGYREASLPIRVDAGIPVNAIVALASKPKDEPPPEKEARAGDSGVGIHEVEVIIVDPRNTPPREVYRGKELLVVEAGQTFEQAITTRRDEAWTEWGAHVLVEIRRTGAAGTTK